MQYSEVSCKGKR